jgi:hypothetical protein
MTKTEVKEYLTKIYGMEYFVYRKLYDGIYFNDCYIL